MTSQHPNLERKSRDFDPANLARSVIALPLLAQIDQELKYSDQFIKEHPSLLETYNAAVFLRKDFPGGLKAALESVRELLLEADTKVGARKPSRIDDPNPQIGDNIAPAALEGAVIRRLLRMAAAGQLSGIEGIWPSRFEVIIDINLDFKPLDGGGGDPRQAAKALIGQYIETAKQEAGVADPDQGMEASKTKVSNQYVFAWLEGSVIKKLVEVDQREAERLTNAATAATPAIVKQAVGRKGKANKATQKAIAAAPDVESSRFRTIHHIWPDFEIRSCITRSVRTVKADAARNSFAALGEGITWGVMDTGIDGSHPHFALHKNIDAASPYHADFTGATNGAPLQDEYGHGTHVAGIIAGEQSLKEGADPANMLAVSQERDASDKTVIREIALESVSGVAPKCMLVSLKVLDEFGMGNASSVIAAIAHVQMLNGYGRDLKIHGVNLSLGHSFDPQWFACGHSPLCTEVNRLVKSGVVVVVAAGNTGYGTLQTKEGKSDTCLDLTINDPGNAEYAITVGSTHREMPHMYGVSYFSSKGPTGDGRYKPDLLAPGEKIISCAAPGSKLVKKSGSVGYNYFENSGTSMAAPHVSGAVAAFLSIRREFIGEAEKVKQIFTSTATDLGRERYFQGAGLVDLLRAIQSV